MKNEIDKLKDEVAKLTNHKIPQWVYWIWFIGIISLASSIASLFGVYHNISWNIESVSLGITLSFVGILATFVVISNYSQVKDIESKFNEKIDQIKEENEKLKKEYEIQAKKEYERLIKENICSLKKYTQVLSAISYGSICRDSKQYYNSLDYFFIALNYSLNDPTLRDEKFTALALITQLINRHGSEISGLNRAYREKYIDIIKHVSDSHLEEIKNTIMDFLTQDKESPRKTNATVNTKKVSIVGRFDVSQEELAKKLKEMGTDFSKTISKLTDIVFVGKKPSLSKLNKIKELQEAGFNTRVIQEFELNKILEFYN